MKSILEKVKSFVTELLSESLSPTFRYHNLVHTKRVVAGVEELTKHYRLDDGDRLALLLAAWLHDTGYTQGCEAHEEKSCEIARKFLRSEGCDSDAIDVVCQLILATERYHQPNTLMESILRDADAAHFGQDQFTETSELLRQELELLSGDRITSSEWRNANIEMLQNEHRFYTEYAQDHWDPVKQDHLKKLFKAPKPESKPTKEGKAMNRIKAESPERSVQSMYRIGFKNHMQLSSIADTKANILLSVNAIIISLMIANLIPKLDNPSNEYLILPTIVILVFSITSMVLSILATRPQITSGKFTRDDVANHKVNLLFFGNFHKMQIEEYEWAMQEMIASRAYILNALTRDLYYMGKVLDRKYKLLRWTYTFFMIGMVFSVLVFFATLKFYVPGKL